MEKNSKKFELGSIIAKGAMMKESAGRPKSKKILNPKKINFWRLSRASDFRLFNSSVLNNVTVEKVVTKQIDQGIFDPYKIATKVSISLENRSIRRSIYFYIDQISYDDVIQYIEGGLSSNMINHDLRVLACLRDVPSFDGFIVADVLRKNELECPDEFLQIDSDEWEILRDACLNELEPLTQMAIGDQFSSYSVRKKAAEFVDVLWDLKELQKLSPLSVALRIDPNRERETYNAWKGIVYYVLRSTEALEFNKFNQNLLNQLITVYPRMNVLRVFLNHLKSHDQTLIKVSDYYKDCYHKKFLKEGRVNFLQELFQSAESLYWILSRTMLIVESFYSETQYISPMNGHFDSDIKRIEELCQELSDMSNL